MEKFVLVGNAIPRMKNELELFLNLSEGLFLQFLPFNKGQPHDIKDLFTNRIV